ncbi:MAG: hypothetical protein ACR2MT_08135 [Aurantibacter sp.]
MKFPVRILLTILGFLLVVGFSCNSKNDDIPKDVIDPTDTIKPIDTTDNTVKLDTVVFSVIGDVPYDSEQRDGLIAMIQEHNTKGTTSEFVVHVGDIKPGADPCDEAVYQDINGILKEFSTPTFMVLGDNEYNDCNDPPAALQLWNQYFLNFHQNWTFDQDISYQANRAENFAWVQDKVMFMGLNLVGSEVHDQDEWDTRLVDNGTFLRDFVAAHRDSSQALVIFGHANMIELGAGKFETFTDVMRSVAAGFEKPVLYMQGDAHFWFLNRPYEEQNILRVQIEGGANAVQVTVNPNLDQPFSFDRNFLD